MIYACPHTSNAVIAASTPKVQNTTFRNPSWKTESAVTPNANIQNMTYLQGKPNSYGGIVL